MPYVTKDLEDEDDEQKQAPSLLGTAPMASPGMTTGVGGAQAQPQRNQAQKGTGFVGLQSWLDAGKGRDKAVTDKGTTALTNEQSSLKTASDKAETGLAGQNVLAVTDSVQSQLDREAGITPGGPTVTPKPVGSVSTPSPQAPQTPRPAAGLSPISMGGVGFGPGAIRRINPPAAPAATAPVAQPPTRSAPTIAPDTTGPTLEQVLGQKYTGPESIDYKPGQDLTDLALLSNTNTIADVTGRAANEAGQYSKYSGMRSLDDALYGSDGATVTAAGSNMKSGKDFAKSTDEKVSDFEKRVGEKSKRMSDQATATRSELEGINKSELERLEAAAAKENERAVNDSTRTDMVMNPETGEYVPVPKGHELGDWEGSAAGTATSRNMASDSDRKRFSALEKLLGLTPSSGEEVDPYVAGRRATTQTPGELEIGPSQDMEGQYKLLLETMSNPKMSDFDRISMRNGLRRHFGNDNWDKLEAKFGISMPAGTTARKIMLPNA